MKEQTGEIILNHWVKSMYKRNIACVMYSTSSSIIVI